MGGEVIFVVDSNTGIRGDSSDDVYAREGSNGEKGEGLFYIWVLNWWFGKSRGFAGAEIS